ncbi:sulfotransferase family protein [Sphingomonas jeddahensis]|uniref:Sulfotransferase domain protein n=1 Tax=Sphingomonas jeddahensis TaxID=1915074 RepID=A0A1V2EUS8_9SPHN|nr:sulfotransferase [Sphingomonas jeddahensis]ONF96431.1 Sulfotransferase domain protein [Sphingomonas jeddahensis]
MSQEQAEAALLREIAALANAGRLAAARDRAEEALAARDAMPVRELAAMLALRLGDRAGAVAHLDRLHAARPDDRAIRLNLAQALTGTEDVSRIAPLLAPLPSEPRVDRIAAYAALRGGEHAAALALYARVLEAWPEDAESWANRAQAELALGDGDAAISSLETAITHRRDAVPFYLALIAVLERLDRQEARRTVARDAAAIAPDNVDVQLALGLAEAANGDDSAAEAALRRAVTLDRSRPEAMLELGLLLESRNRLDTLAELIVHVRPYAGGELALLEGWLAFRRGELDRAAVHAGAIPPTIGAHRRAHLRALIADRQGDAAKAFTLFEEMNAGALAVSGPAPARRYRDGVAASTEALRAAPVAAVAAGQHSSPVFIAGFPRSGTTLLDTLLGRLPNAHVLEEQPLVPALERAVGDPGRIAGLDGAALTALRAQYRTMAAEIVPQADRRLLIDKHPLHMARMPLIARLFPGAPVLLVERHPYDVVLSCFMANFRLNGAMRSFTDLTEAALTYDTVFTAWREAETRLGLNAHRIRYERLVADPEPELRAALAFIGADYSPELLDTAAAARERGPVKTASYAQVIEPIHQRAVARWQRYRGQLAPVIPILRPWAEWMGYDG